MVFPIYSFIDQISYGEWWSNPDSFSQNLRNKFGIPLNMEELTKNRTSVKIYDKHDPIDTVCHPADKVS